MNGNQGGGGAFGPPGGGGAFGPPGGGGGGFGSPPGAPPGGGAFGPPGGGAPGGFGPPGGGAPPSGGAFGPPGGTNLGGGGGAFGPPGGGGGGGEGPLSHIPFTPQEEANIGGAGKMMFFAGIMSLLTALVTLAKSGVELWAAPELNAGTIAGAVCVNVISVGLAAVFGVWLFAGAKALRKVVETNEDDQIHLVQAIQKLRQIFALKAALILLVFLLACLVGIVLGGAMAAGGLS